MSTPPIVLVRGAGFENKGAEAMLLTVRDELRRRLPNVIIRAELREESHDQARDYGIVPLARQWVMAPALVRALKCLRGVVQKPGLAGWILRSPGEFLRSERALSGCSMMLDVSGFAYSDTFGVESVQETLPFLHYAHAHKIPTWFLPQAWGPFGSSQIQQDLQQLVASASRVYARDAVSLAALQSVVGHDASNVFTCPDIAFLFNGSSSDGGASCVPSVGISGSRLVGLVPNMRIYERTSGSAQENQYVRLLVSIVSILRRRDDMSVVLMPHEIDEAKSQAKDDRYICGLIKAHFLEDHKVSAITKAHTARELKAIIANLDVLLSSRYHSIIAALSSGVPPLVIGWSHKYEELLNDFNMGDNLFDIHSSLPEVIAGKVGNILKEKDTLRESILARTEVMKQQGKDMFDQICRVIQSGRT